MFQCCMRPWAQSSVGSSLGDPCIFRVKTKFNKKQRKPVPALRRPSIPCARSPAQGCASVLLASNSWLSCGRTGLCRRRGPQSPHIASALHGRRLIPSAEDAPQTRPSAARKSRGTQTMRDRKRCGIEHACACAEQWQANQTKRPLPPKGDDDHVMMCSTQKVEVRKKRDFSRGE